MVRVMVRVRLERKSVMRQELPTPVRTSMSVLIGFYPNSIDAHVYYM